jgi:hypothetical protein
MRRVKTCSNILSESVIILVITVKSILLSESKISHPPRKAQMKDFFPRNERFGAVLALHTFSIHIII